MRIRSMFIVACWLISSAAWADREDAADSARTVVQGLDGPSATAAGPSNATKVSAQASGDTSQAATQLSHIWAITDRGALNGNVMAAAPFSDSNAPKADVGSVSGLAAGVNTRIDARWIFLPAAPVGSANETATADYNQKCDAFIQAALGSQYYYNVTDARLKTDPQSIYAIGLFDKAPACKDLARGSNLSDFVTQANVQIAARNKSQVGGSPAPLLKIQPGWRNAAKAANRDFDDFDSKNSATLYSAGLSLLGNQHSYSYVNAASPSKVIKQSTEGYGIGINGAVYLNKMSFLAGFSYERPFKGSPAQQVCSPIGSTTSTSCISATVGAPMRTTARVFSAEARILVTGSFALAPRVEYDTASSNYGIKLPVFFVPNAKKVLTGGLQIGWTKQNRYQGAVVIQKAFKFWN